MSRLLTALALLLLLTPAAHALDPTEMFADPTQEARARDIGRQLRCLKCRNQSIFDSNAGLARDLRRLVRDRMRAGDSDQQILDYVHDRYGDYVLLKPPVTANTYALWLAPIVLVLLGAGGGIAYLRQRPAPKPANQLTAADRAEARRILNGEIGG